MLTGRQIAAARSLLGWRQRDLAAAAGVSEGTIKNLEAGRRAAFASTLQQVEKALTQAGVVFLEEGQPSSKGGLGVRLKRKTVLRVPGRKKSPAEAGRAARSVSQGH